MPAAATAQDRRESLTQVFAQARVCERCPQLVATRTQVVFGAGSADADLLFVGEAPGRSEDEQGVPFVGAAGKLLTELLGEVGIAREDVFIANVLKCRPPDNRNPLPEEIERCSPWLWRQIELIEPTLVVTLGNFATKLLRGDTTGITQLHGRVEDRLLGTRMVRLMPSYHPAAALYQRSNRELIAADFAQIPALLAQGPPAQSAPDRGVEGDAGDQEPGDARAEPTAEDLAAARGEPAAEIVPVHEPEPAAPPPPPVVPGDEQLGLF